MPSIKELRSICQKSEEAPSWSSQSIEGRINRIFSIYITWFLIHTPITPNQITALGVAVYFAGAAMFLFNEATLHYIGLGLLFLSFILDACDGEVARYKKLVKGGGVGGVYVEPLSHDIMYAFYFLPIGIGASLASGSLLPFAASFVATVSKLLFRLAEFRYDAFERFSAEQRGEIRGWTKNIKTPKTAGYFAFRNIFTSTGMFLLLIAAVLAKHMDWYLYFYSAGLFLLWVFKLARQWKKIKNAAGHI